MSRNQKKYLPLERAGETSTQRSVGRNTKDEVGNVVSLQTRTTTAQARATQANAAAQLAQNFEADLVCLSHLRWDFVYQRPQHLLSRCAKQRRVFFVEEPIFGQGPSRLDVSQREDGVHVVVPHLPEGLSSEVAVEAIQQAMIDRLFAEHQIRDYVLWYYTPMALGWTRHLKPLATVYDCMDELSMFKNAPRSLRDREAELFRRADLVFTGGQSLYEAKRDQHANVYAFPSSIDRAHFAQARDSRIQDPADQAGIPHPRMGFFGVVDERFDIELLDAISEARPDWHFVIIGPVVKINDADLPRRANIHYLGSKSYKELPMYLAGWDVAALLFARNDSTRFISPTKTPEYLAAGRPVVSTSIRDVVRPYGKLGLVRIADDAAEFVKAAAEIGMDERVEDAAWLARVDEFLAKISWDRTWGEMAELIGEVAASRRATIAASAQQSKPAPATTKQPSVTARAVTASSSATAAD
ncbi:MAG TPA: glycosyltransferase family 1 protein [Pyrinomonadaceae bacterium]|jgi:UDP-galactopyranose mutase|nr:glycosyltransferase family 1 protein [Pyrinomonadaceae bacterium]